MKYMKSFTSCIYLLKIQKIREPILPTFTDPPYKTTKIYSSTEIFRGQSSILASAMAHKKATISLDSSSQPFKHR